ncbi:MAG: SGNH/GDSL hydrolase family protein [Clostridia bacterium]|nr:SGNH/GDSL hydrolase family protein [Clostridia bacterium]
MKKLLILGDDIAYGYKKSFAEHLGDGYSVIFKEIPIHSKHNDCLEGEICVDSGELLSCVESEYKDKCPDCDIIIFNCGLQDIKYNWMEEKIQIEKQQYEDNLIQICDILKNTGASVYFVNSTPIYDEVHNSMGNIIKNGEIVRRPHDLEEYNKIAQRVVLKNGIPVIDLYSFTKAMGISAVRDHIHYHEKYENQQGKYIADYIINKNKD